MDVGKDAHLRPGLLARIFGRSGPAASIPAGSRVYAIGDIHGRLDLLDQLWTQILADAAPGPPGVMVVFLGDYVDRGPDSKGVIDFLLNARLNGLPPLCLRGNHDQAILDFLADGNFWRSWEDFGAPDTLESYGVTPPIRDDEGEFERARRDFAAALPPQHLQFFAGLPDRHVIGDYAFVHAGLRPGVSLEKQDVRDLLWIRDEFLVSRVSFGKVVVHGHTPGALPVRRPNRIGVDTGAYATGRLTAVVLEGTGCRFLQT